MCLGARESRRRSAHVQVLLFRFLMKLARPKLELEFSLFASRGLAHLGDTSPIASNSVCLVNV